MSDSGPVQGLRWWKPPLLYAKDKLQQREDQVFLVLALVIGALTGLAVVAFILVTERLGMRLYPQGAAAWRRVLFPIVGSLGIGYLLYRYFPYPRGAECRRPKLRSTPVKGESCCAPFSESFSVPPQPWPAEFLWGARGLRSDGKADG